MSFTVDAPQRATATAQHLPIPQVLAAVLASARQAARAQFSFRASTWAAILGTILQVVLVYAVWHAVYGARTVVSGVDQQVAITYAVLGVLTSAVFQPFVFDTIYGRLRSGAIIFDVMRPVSAVPTALAQQVGAAAGQIPAVSAGLVTGIVIGAITLPGSPVTAVAFLVSLLLGFAVSIVLNFLTGLVGFWTLEVGGAFLIIRMFSQFASGALIPLWFMPAWLATPLAFLPFSAQVFIPLSIYSDTDPGWHTVGDLGVQLLWVVVLVALTWTVWRRAIRRLVVFGG